MSNAPSVPESVTSSSDCSAVPKSDDPLDRIEVKCVTSVKRAFRMALSLRMAESLLTRLLEDGLLPDGEDLEETLKRRVELLYIAAWIEEPARSVRPPEPPHQRPKQSNSKMVWCQAEGCTRALTRDQAKLSPLCPECFPKTVKFKKPAAK